MQGTNASAVHFTWTACGTHYLMSKIHHFNRSHVGYIQQITLHFVAQDYISTDSTEQGQRLCLKTQDPQLCFCDTETLLRSQPTYFPQTVYTNHGRQQERAEATKMMSRAQVDYLHKTSWLSFLSRLHTQHAAQCGA